MYKYILKRIIMLIPVIIGITFIVFSIVSFTPGNPGRLILGVTASEESVNQLNEKLGVNDPFIIKYKNYMCNAIKGDFGKSYNTGEPVLDVLLQRFPTTLRLAITAILIASLVGIPLGIISSVKQHSFIDSLSMISALLFASIPGFWLGLMLILLFALKLGIFPVTGDEAWLNYVLPSITIAAPTTAIITRVTRSTMLEVITVLRITRSTMLEEIRQDYIRTAKAKGANKLRIIWKHSLKNTMIPVITIMGMDFGYLLGGTIIVEVLFGMSGVGQIMVKAIRMKDMPIIMASVTLLAAIFCILNLIVDLLYAYIDPRIKAMYKS